jgi:hypothetical protein
MGCNGSNHKTMDDIKHVDETQRINFVHLDSHTCGDPKHIP